jgi:phenylacetate-CoA ligase
MKEALKRIADHIPYPIGRALGKIPMSLRLGKAYNVFSENSKKIVTSNIQKNCHFDSLHKILSFSQNNIKFYQDFYKKSDFSPSQFKTIEDISLIPIVNKSDLQKYSLLDRSFAGNSLKKSNTGGTTGQPLNFYLEKSAYAREWAHMHAIWKSMGYSYTDEKITIRGKNIGNCYYKYNFNQNEFLINAYAPLRDNISTCRELITKRNIKWIHGYPSSVYSFLRELECVDPLLFEILISKVRGVFLGSEYPAPQYRTYIEKHCGLKTISWYGHSEMAVLAPEREPGSGVYYPFHSYGFAEAEPHGDTHRLVATSTHNFATPLIRYDTGDLIEPTFKDGLLESFRIKEGRNSENVIDLNGRVISLTGLIFGRHHKAFDRSEHIQVKQLSAGKIEIIITSKDTCANWSELFDFTNAFFEIKFSQIDTPIRTPSGKVQLLLR